MRKLVWFTVGFGAATAVGAYLLSGIVLIVFALVLALAALLLLLSRKERLFIIATVMIGLSIGFLHNWCFDRVYLSDIRQYDGQTVTIKVTASDYSFETGYCNAVDGQVSIDSIDYDVRVYYYMDTPVSPGDILNGQMCLRYTAYGGERPSTYHKGDGIFLLAYAEEDLQIRSSSDSSAIYFASHLRKTISNTIEQTFPEDTAFFAKALLLGDDGDIGYEDNVAFQKSGLRHIVAVSGLHVSILFSALYFVTGRKRLLSLLAGLPVLFVFAAVAGFTPSVVRACIMQALVILSAAVDREYDPATALSFSALVILFVNPLAITSVSFQLSVGCMIGIFAFSHSIRRYLLDAKRLGKYSDKGIRGKLVRWFAGSVSVSIGAMTFTLPLCALYFNVVSLIGIVANLLTLWVISFVFCGIVVACLASMLWAPLGAAIAAVVSVAIEYVLLVAKGLSQLPFSVAYTDSIYTVIWILLSYALILLFFLFRQKRILPLVSTVMVLYGFSLLATWLEPRFDSVRISAIDVGQGQCILLQSKDRAYLIDCGGDDPEDTASAAMNWMGAQGISHLDGLILTHYDEDHINGALYLMQVADVDKLYIPDAEPGNPVRRELLKQAESYSVVSRIEEFPCGEGKITLIPSESNKTGNESSMCILFQGENCDILITGDRDLQGEQLLLSQYALPDIEILVAGHHGAATSTGMELLHAINPEIVLISVGQNNSHGHPDAAVTNRLINAGCVIYRTDLDGTIMIRG